MTHVAVFWTIGAATLAWAFGDTCRLLRRQLAFARLVWTAGAVAFVIHSVSAFVLLYGGSHSRALAATAQQTAALTGVDSSAGLYINYLFLATWIADGIWWWTVPPDTGGRFTLVGWARFGFFLFMFVNGAVVFADGWMRVIGLVAVITVAGALFVRATGRS